MILNVFKNTVLLCFLVLVSCGKNSKPHKQVTLNNDTLSQTQDDKPIIVAANQTEAFLPLINGKHIGIVANQTSVIFKELKTSGASASDSYTHLVDSLVSLNIDVKTVFAPEHGFRGTADAGELVKDGIDTKTGIPIISLYGKNKKPSPEQLSGLDMIIFDIQDVGARFYTYISSLHYVMEACAEQNIPILVLDRPNPNSHYIDGPILEKEHQSFVGMHPIPVVHGMTIGEYAQMINGEAWLDNSVQCDLTVIPIKNYTHTTSYSLPIKPSPNLPNDVAINLYPSLCFFEGTNVSVGRGTDMQFQVAGTTYPHQKVLHRFEFTPQPNEGAKYPKHQGKTCYGYDLSKHDTLSALNLDWLIEFYNANQQYKPEESFFNAFFTKLAGTSKLQEQIEKGLSEKDIRASWKQGLDDFKSTRSKYLLYD